MRNIRSFRPYFRTLLFLSTLVLILGTTIVAFAQAPTFGIRPEDATKGYYQFSLAPGESIQDGLIAENPNDFPLALNILMAPGSTMAAGGISFAEGTSEATDWVTFPDAGTVEIPAASTRALPFQIDIPADALPGEYVVGFVGTLQDPTQSPEIEGVTDSSQSTFKFTVVSQVAIAMIITVSGESNCSAAVSSLSSTPQDGRWQLGIDMQNTGNIHFKATGEVLARPAAGGEPVASRTFSVDYVIPGDTITYPMALEPYPLAGDYLVEVNLVTDCGYQATLSQPVTISKEEVKQAVSEATANQPASSSDEAARILAQAELVRSIALALGGLAALILAIGVFIKWRKPS